MTGKRTIVPDEHAKQCHQFHLANFNVAHVGYHGFDQILHGILENSANLALPLVLAWTLPTWPLGWDRL